MYVRNGAGVKRALEDDLLRTATLTAVPFLQAAETWLETRKPYISPKTAHEYALNIKTLSTFFGEMRLPEITSDMIRAYQKARSAICGPFSINHECSVLQQMLKRIGKWAEIAPDYQPLPLPKEKRGRALSDDERKRLFRVAKATDAWNACRLFALISINTTAGPKEVLSLRLKDIDLENRTILVGPHGAKNEYRVRRIPLNQESYDAVIEAIERAKKFGATEPTHYIFPFGKKGQEDVTKPQTTFKTSWRQITNAAGLRGFRLYDLRHHSITVLLENVAPETARRIAGHISLEMQRRVYSHIRDEAAREAVDVLSNSKKPPKPEPQDEDLESKVLAALANILKKGAK